MSPINFLKGFYFCGMLLLTTLFGAAFLVFPCTFALLHSYALYRRCADAIAGSWFLVPVGIYEIVFGVKLVFTGDSMINDGKTLMLLNHRTYFDWLFFWSWVLRFGQLSHEKIILKASLKKIPGPGWAMQLFQFLFLNRRWEADQPHMSKILNGFRMTDYPLQLLIFPEGTDFDPPAKARSDKYARANNLPIYDYVLHPRTTGFKHCVDMMRGQLDAVYDISVGYPIHLPGKRTSLLFGQFPEEIHFHSKRYSLMDIPKDDKEIHNWLVNVWDQKEALLKQFYKDKHFPGPTLHCARNTDPQYCKIQMYSSFILWHLLVAMSIWGLFNFSLVRHFLVLAITFYLVVTHLFGGFDNIEIALIHKWFAHRSSHHHHHHPKGEHQKSE